MNSKCKLILGIISLTALISLSAYYIASALPEAVAADEKNIELSNDMKKNYLSPISVESVLIDNEGTLRNMMLPLELTDNQKLREGFVLGNTAGMLRNSVVSLQNRIDSALASANNNLVTGLRGYMKACESAAALQNYQDKMEDCEAYAQQKFQQELNQTQYDLFGSCFATIDSKIEKYLNVRQVPNGDVIGMLYPQTGGTVLEVQDGWAKISSGNLIGWVSMDYIATGIDVANAGPTIYVTVESDTLCLRREPSMESETVDILTLGATVRYLSHTAGWVYVDCGGYQGYLSADYVHLTIGDNVAVTMDEGLWIQVLQDAGLYEAPAPAPAPEAAAPAEQPVAETPVSVAPVAVEPTADELARQRIDAIYAEGRSSMAPMYLSADEIYLLASVIMMEAGGESYEGKLAVAGVVLNRIRSGYWGSTLSEVIYAPGQFSGANTGLLAGYMMSGPNEECIRAAYEACAGVHNIGGYLFFCRADHAPYEQFSNYFVIEKQCFYAK